MSIIVHPPQAQFDLYAEPDQGLRQHDSTRAGKNHRHGSEASKRAAIAIAPKTGTQRHQILDEIAVSGFRGTTQWALVEDTGLLRSSICARVKELEEGHWIEKRATRRGPKGSDESVYVATPRGRRAVGLA